LRVVVKSFVDGIHLMRTNPEISKKAINRHMRLNDERELEETYQLLKRVALSSLILDRRNPDHSQRSGRPDPGGENRRSQRICRYPVSRGIGQVGLHRQVVSPRRGTPDDRQRHFD
jgi:hypothetical protein